MNSFSVACMQFYQYPCLSPTDRLMDQQTVYQCSILHHEDCSMTMILIIMNNSTKASCKDKTDCSKDSVDVQFGDTIVLMTAAA